MFLAVRYFIAIFILFLYLFLFNILLLYYLEIIASK